MSVGCFLSHDKINKLKMTNSNVKISITKKFCFKHLALFYKM